MYSGLWYGAITILFISIGIFTCWRRPDRKLLAIYAFLSGLTYLTEYFVLVLFNGYRYFPQVMASPYFDNILGAIVSDAFSVPIAGVVAAAFQLGWAGMMLLSGFLVGVEVLFVHLRIYEHYWWNFAYTAIGLIAWFFLGKRLYRQLQNKVTVWHRFLIAFCTNMLLQASMAFTLAACFDAYRYHIGWFADRTRDHIAFATAMICILSVVFASFVTFQVRWLWRIGVILLLMPLDWLLVQYGVLQLSNWWSPAFFIALRIALVAILQYFDRFVLGRRRLAAAGPH